MTGLQYITMLWITTYFYKIRTLQEGGLKSDFILNFPLKYLWKEQLDLSKEDITDSNAKNNIIVMRVSKFRA